MANQVVPETPILSKQTYASPTSFVGATRRLVPPMVGWSDNIYLQIVIWTFVIVPVMYVVYQALLIWYVVIFGVFGLFVIPWRLHRRAERKSAQVQNVQLATMQALMADRMNHNDA